VSRSAARRRAGSRRARAVSLAALLACLAAASPLPPAGESARAAEPGSVPLRIVHSPDPAAYYPARERRAGTGGTAIVDLTLDPAGRVKACAVAQRSGSAALDRAACRVAAALRFAPPVAASPARLEVAWAAGTARARLLVEPEPARIRNVAAILSAEDYPAAALRAEEEGTTEVELAAGADGRVTGCIVVGSSGSSALDSASCRIAARRVRLDPARDRYGDPVPGPARLRLDWRIEG
jgi:protein TonB